MEESEKRRERLQAMRMEASQAEILSSSSAQISSSTQIPFPSSSSNPPVHLSNPLVHPSPPASDRSPPVPRFDFYTDPMAAFSGAKRRSGGGGRGCYYPPENLSSPVRTPSPMSHQLYGTNAGPMNYHMATPHAPPHQFQLNQSPDQGLWRSPIQFPGPLSGYNRETPPPINRGAWNMSGGSSGHSSGFPSNYSSRSAGITSPMSNPGIRGGSPHSNSGRGKGWQFRGSGGGSPSPGWGGGRGRGFYHDHGSARQHFYIKAMVKDPWRKVKPIVGNILVPMDGSGSWIPKSLGVKKARVAAESVGEFKSQSSLAECLALSLEEAINDV